MTMRENIHDLARRMAAQSRSPMTVDDARSILGKRGAKKRNYGTLQFRTGQFPHVESPKRPFWWNNE